MTQAAISMSTLAQQAIVIYLAVTSLARGVTTNPLPQSQHHAPSSSDARQLASDVINRIPYGSADDVMAELLTSDVRVDADRRVCRQAVNSPSINQRSSCPWHYEAADLGDGVMPRTVLVANLTCQNRCLKVHGTHERRYTAMPCLAVNRIVTVFNCSSTPSSSQSSASRSLLSTLLSSSASTSSSVDRADGRCCRKQQVAVPVAYTCGFLV